MNSSVRRCPTTQLMLRVAALTLLALSTLTVCASGRFVATAAVGSYVYDAPTIACVRVHAIGAAEASAPLVGDGREGSAPPTARAGGTSTTSSAASVATEAGTDLVKHDADFAAGQLTSGGNATASQLGEFGSSQGWARTQSETGQIRYTDENGVR